MSFTSWEFCLLFAIVFIGYYAINDKLKKWILLLGSSVFIGYYNIWFLVMAVATATLTYFSGIYIANKQDEKPRLLAFKIGLIVHLAILVLFKYLGFIESNINHIVNLLGGDWNNITAIFLPLGISFYLFQSISYLIDIYWEEIEPEKNYSNFMLYMLFFMKFLSGPIERAEHFLPQIQKSKKFDYDLALSGVQLIAIGLFKKLIIADRLAPVLNSVFSNVHDYSSAQLLVATIFYPIQLYADFSGYTDMAIGGAALLGYKISINFNRPFIAESLADFWRRWHMTLSFWVRDYLYEPIAMNRRAWGVWGIAYALIITFVLLGLWHGGSWNFVIYGAIQGIVISYEIVAGKKRQSLLDKLPKGVAKAYNMLRTYLIFAFSLLFFRIATLPDVYYTVTNLFGGIKYNFKELNIGLRDHDLIVLLVAIFMLFFYEYANNKWDIWKRLEHKPTAIRWAVYYLLLIILFTQSVSGANNFIYIQF